MGKLKIAETLMKQAEYILYLEDEEDKEEILEIGALLQKIRADIEDGRYDTDKKKWSDEKWRV